LHRSIFSVSFCPSYRLLELRISFFHAWYLLELPLIHRCVAFMLCFTRWCFLWQWLMTRCPKGLLVVQKLPEMTMMDFPHGRPPPSSHWYFFINT
jgi:hypothetical protein